MHPATIYMASESFNTKLDFAIIAAFMLNAAIIQGINDSSLGHITFWQQSKARVGLYCI